MKKQSHSKVIHIWNEYDFTLYIPADLTGFNKPHISFNYMNENTGKKERVKKFIKKHKGDLKLINLDAKIVALDLVRLLQIYGDNSCSVAFYSGNNILAVSNRPFKP